MVHKTESSCATATPPALEAAPRSASCNTLPMPRSAAGAVGAAASPLRRPLSHAPLHPPPPQAPAGSGTRMRLRRSDASCIERARARTLRMTITIVAAFIWCWTPYVVMTLWYMFDRESAKRVDQRLQDALFIMAVSNSCVNPLVYGSYAMRSCPLLHRRRDRERAAVAQPLLMATRPPPRRRHVGALPPTAISWRATADAASRTSSSASSSHQRPATR